MIFIIILRQRQKLKSCVRSIKEDNVHLCYTTYLKTDEDTGVAVRGYDIFDNSGFEDRIGFYWSNRYKGHNG